MNLNQSLLMRALARQTVPRPPIWFMRQAGRYLPEYRQTRAKAGDFLSLCKSKELACEVTLQPLRRFNLDAAILFSDILTIPDAMGLGLHFVEGEGPCFSAPLRDAASIRALRVPVAEESLGYVMDALRLIRASLPADMPLIGFSGSPWTLATYMIEGGSSKEFKRPLVLMYRDPALMKILLGKLTEAVTDYLIAQVKAGASALMIFDTWGGLLSSWHYQQFSLAYMSDIVKRVRLQCPQIPIILYTKGGGQWLDAMASSGCQALGLDWTTQLGLARQQVGHRVALQGNLDPTVLLGPASCIKSEVFRVLDDYGPGPGHIFNLGHGIKPEVNPDHVQRVIDAVHEWAAIHR